MRPSICFAHSQLGPFHLQASNMVQGTMNSLPDVQEMKSNMSLLQDVDNGSRLKKAAEVEKENPFDVPIKGKK